MITLLVCTHPHLCFPLVFPPTLICICPRPLVFLPTVVCARSYLLPGHILGHPIHGLYTLIWVYPCSLFLGAIICAHLSSALICRLSLSVVGVCLSFAPIPTYRPCAPLVVQSISSMHSFRSAFVHAHTHFHSCPLLFLPAIVYTCTYLLLMCTLICLCLCSVSLSVCAHACCCWLEYLGLPIIHN